MYSGFAFIYLAEDQHGQRYAIKLVRCTSKGIADKSKREGIILSKFNHKNIIKIEVKIILLFKYTWTNHTLLKDMCMIKEDKLKMLYIIMPFYKVKRKSRMMFMLLIQQKRGNLEDLINEYNKKGEHLKEDYILFLFKQICFGIKALVEYKNRQGIITPWAHRDIKPA